MSTRHDRQAPDYWFDGGSPPLLASALSGVYAKAVEWRRGLYRRGWLESKRVAAPVIVVGNLIAGGSGKTPLTIAIVERLLAEGFRPGVATRGYGRRDESKAIWVDKRTAPQEGGDEPVLIARRTGVKVRADRRRADAARALVDAGCDVVVCDDGLQHYALVRDIEVEVVDGRRRYGNGRMLPAGPLREPPERGAECDFRVVNLAPEHDTAETVPREPGFGEWPMRLAADRAVLLVGARQLPLSSFAGKRVHAVAGTGDPTRFFDMLRGFGIAVVPHAFPDHHAYVAEDLAFGSDLPILMTDKDAVKCEPFANERCYRIPVDGVLPEAFWVALLDRLRDVRQRTVR